MSKPSFRNSFFVSVALIVFSPAAMGAVNGSPGQGKREPIVITANRMEADKLGSKVTFKGNVTLKKESMTLNSDSMVVLYDQPARGIREIDAQGNVVVRKEGRLALSNRALYYSREEKIVLTGDARIVEKENQLGGDRITLFMRDDRSIVEGGKVLFYQDERKGETAGGK